MSETPLVSIVTPSFNQGAFLEETILSVLEQDYAPIEYIVMDGGSQDNSLKILEKYSDRIAAWESKPDRGQAHAINKGLRRAHGEILGWINSDDLLMPGMVRRVVDIFSEEAQIDVVYGRLERINANGETLPTPTLPKDVVTFSKRLVIGECLVNQPGSFWRRRIMEEVGLLNESLNYALDYEYWIRMALHDASFKKLADVVAQFRLSEDSKTVAFTSAMAEEQLHVLDEFLGKSDIAARLDLSAEQVKSQTCSAESHIGLHAFYGCLKAKEWRKAGYWFHFVCRTDARVLLERRWIDLGWASIKRRIK